MELLFRQKKLSMSMGMISSEERFLNNLTTHPQWRGGRIKPSSLTVHHLLMLYVR